MEILNILAFVGAAILFAVAVILVKGFVKLHKIQTGYTSLRIACAGSGESEYPFSEIINNSMLERVKAFIDSQKEPDLYTPYLVKGNSMQYANLKPDDILIAKRTDMHAMRSSFPSIVVVDVKNANAGECKYKIRRAWDIVNANASEIEFKKIVDTTLYSEQFSALRERAKEKCPDEDTLRCEIISEFKKRQTNGDFLLSTTYKTDEERIYFSLHSITSIAGVAEFVSSNPYNNR